MGLFNEHSSTTKTDSSSTQGIPGPQGIGYKLDANGNFDIENKKLTNVQNGDMDRDVMTKSQIEGYVSNKTQYLDGVLPAKVTNNKAVIYSPSGGIHSNGLYLRDQNGQESHFINELQDLNQCRLYIPNLKDNDSFGGRLKSSVMVTSINQTIEGKKIFHDIQVPTPVIDGHASNKAYVDNEISNAIDNFNYVEKSGDTMIGPLIVPKDNYPIQGDLNKVISYETQREIFLSKKEGGKMLQPIDMNGFSIDNLTFPTSSDQACSKGYLDTELNHKLNRNELNGYLKADGSIKVTGSIDFQNNRLLNIPEPHFSHEAANKSYLLKQFNHLNSLFLDLIGGNRMLGNLDMNKHKIINIENPTNSTDACSKEYVDVNIKKAQISESHTPKNILSYIMADIDQTSSEYGIEIEKIDNYEDSFHTYNKKVIYLNLLKNNNNYRARIGYNIFRLVDKNINKIYTICTEWLTSDNNAWNKMEIFCNITAGLILNHHSQKFENGHGLYYIRTITTIKILKISSAPLFFFSTIHIDDINPTYPNKFKEIYNIIYGITGNYNNISPKTYDLHDLYEKSGENMKMVVNLDMNQKAIKNIGNISDMKLYGIVKNHIFSSHNIRVSFNNIFLKKIILYGNEKTVSKNGVINFEIPGLTIPTFRFTFPSDQNQQIVMITINTHYKILSRILLLDFNNLPFLIVYSLFY